MADYHTTYKGPEGQTTQWEDIQVKLGNMAPRAPKHKAAKFEGEAETVKDGKWIREQDEDVLSDHEDDFTDDRDLENLRQQRLDEMKEASARPHFTSMTMIRASDFKHHVTDASLSAWVVVLLFKDDHEGCAILADCFTQLAARHCRTKFVKIISTDCIANFPDAKLPTVLLYHEDAALVLNQEGEICRTDGEAAAEQEEREVRQLVKRVVLQRQQDADDEDSDFSD